MHPLLAALLVLAGFAFPSNANSTEIYHGNDSSRADWANEPEDAGPPACTCDAETLDCGMAGLRRLNLSEHRCAWPVRRVVLRQNALRALPPLPESVEDVDVSWNAFAQLPRAAQLSAGTRALNVAWNGASSAGDELHSLRSLEELRVEGNRLATLRFLPSPCALRVLRAGDNALWQLDDALGRCERLRELDLSGNVLGAASAGVLARLRLLEELRIARCRLALLPPAAFQGLRNLRALDLSDNELQVLPLGAIHHLDKLRNLYIRGNRLRVLPPEATFSRFPLLEDLHLSSNAISVLSENTFANLTFLETLELDSNRLHSLPPGIFSGLINLQRLVLSGNPLPAASLVELAPLRNLKSLYLDRCAIRELPSQAFAAQRRLSTLSACCNRMHSVSEDALQGLLQLRSLKLNNNSLDALPDNLFRDVPGLKVLDVSRNRLHALPTVIFTHLRFLSILDASSNRLRALPALDECCAPPRSAMFQDNELRAPDAAALHSWLRAGGESTLLDLRATNARFDVDRLAAALDTLRASEDVRVVVDPADCACGGVSLVRGGALVQFCVDTPCAFDVPGVPTDWTVVVLRAAAYSRVATVVAMLEASGDAAATSAPSQHHASFPANGLANA
ncbi:Toll-like receptor 7 [Gryllus bimaculatus]|nr:Toll-like receptor 7 [Gryllus bimaculatus]